MRITYDAVADAAYIYLSRRGGSVWVEEVDEDIFIDFNQKNQIVGIEVLAASKRLSMPELEPLMEKLEVTRP